MYFGIMSRELSTILVRSYPHPKLEKDSVPMPADLADRLLHGPADLKVREIEHVLLIDNSLPTMHV